MVKLDGGWNLFLLFFVVDVSFLSFNFKGMGGVANETGRKRRFLRMDQPTVCADIRCAPVLRARIGPPPSFAGPMRNRLYQTCPRY